MIEDVKPKHFVETNPNTYVNDRKQKRSMNKGGVHTVGRKAVMEKDLKTIREGKVQKTQMVDPKTRKNYEGYNLGKRQYGVGKNGRVYPVSGDGLYALDKRQMSKYSKLKTPEERLKYAQNVKKYEAQKGQAVSPQKAISSPSTAPKTVTPPAKTVTPPPKTITFKR